MPRFYFNYRQGTARHVDDTGLAFKDFEEAYLEAYEAALSMWPELLRARCDPRACAFEVTDEVGRSLFTLPFSEVLEACERQDRGRDFKKSSSYQDVLASRQLARRRFVEFRDQMGLIRGTLAEAKALVAATEDWLRSNG